MQQRQVSRQAYLDSTPCWESLAQATHKHMLHFLGTPTTEVNTVTDGLHNAVFATFCEHFPPGSVPRSVQTWRPALCTILNKWERRRRMLRPGLISLPNLFRVWHHAARFAHLKRVHRKEAKQIRNAQFNEVVVTATAAAEQHNTHKLFHLINRFAPKQPRKQIQIRNQQGMLATPIESAAIINKFVGDTWAGPCSMQLTFDQPPGVPFTIQQLEKALSLIPVTKAVAKPFAPGVIWRHSASVLAPLLHQQLQLWWSTSPPLIPDCWRHGWLFLIPKPNRPPSIPENLRPLALQEPVGKGGNRAAYPLGHEGCQCSHCTFSCLVLFGASLHTGGNPLCQLTLQPGQTDGTAWQIYLLFPERPKYPEKVFMAGFRYA